MNSCTIGVAKGRPVSRARSAVGLIRNSGILQQARDAGVCPKLMHLDTESDAWQARSSLVVTDPGGGDIAMPDDVRVYLASGVQHAAPRPMAKQVTQLPGNPLGYGAFMRSLLIALVGPWSALLVIVIQRCVGGFYLASVFAPNHKGMPQVESGQELDFLRSPPRGRSHNR